MFTIKEFVIDVLNDKLDEYEGSTTCGGDLYCLLLEQYNTDGSYTYNIYKAEGWVKLHFDELGDIVHDMTVEGLPPCNVFENPEAFQVQIMLYVAGQLLGQCDAVNEFWNEEQELTQEIIDKIKEELDNL